MAAARLQPEAGAASEEFWEATKQRRYLVQWCDACARPIFHPREVCPQCLGAGHLAWRESTGTGTVHAVSVQHRPANPAMTDQVPYAVALVDLDAGGRGSARASDGEPAPPEVAPTIRVMSNVVGCEPTSVAVGDSVELTWEPLDDGRHLPLFRPVGES
jgi:uncharacterized OB-fold protein